MATKTLECRTLTAAEVAAVLGLHTQTIYNLANRGELPCMRVGDRLLFSKRTLSKKWPDFFGDDPTPPRPPVATAAA